MKILGYVAIIAALLGVNYYLKRSPLPPAQKPAEVAPTGPEKTAPPTPVAQESVPSVAAPAPQASAMPDTSSSPEKDELLRLYSEVNLAKQKILFYREFQKWREDENMKLVAFYKQGAEWARVADPGLATSLAAQDALWNEIFAAFDASLKSCGK